MVRVNYSVILILLCLFLIFCLFRFWRLVSMLWWVSYWYPDENRLKTACFNELTKKRGMPVQTPQWTDVLCCCICYNLFDGVKHQPISLVCAHTACRACLLKLKSKQCPFDQSAINIAVADLVQNSPILKILDVATPNEDDKIRRLFEVDDGKKFKEAVDILESLTIYLKRAVSEKGLFFYT